MLTLSPCTLNVFHRMKSQMSIDERRYEAPTSAPLALAELETTTPDVVPDTGPLYDDLNTLSKKVNNYCFVSCNNNIIIIIVLSSVPYTLMHVE